jgi:hypothetical protein
MSWNPFKKKETRTKVSGFAEQDNSGEWFQYFSQYINSLGNDKLIKFCNENAFELASNVAEIFIPIDAIADRVASVPYVIRNKKTLEIYEPKGNLARLVEQPNPFDRLSDLVYKSVFSELSDGNSYVYTKTPNSIKNPTIDNISNIWVLKPNVTAPVFLKTIPNPFLIKSKDELIAFYKTHFMYKHELEPRYVLHRTSLGVDSDGRSRSPLKAVEMNINNIMAVYQARYNVYAKNGNGGILSKAPNSENSSIAEAVDPITRDRMLEDLQSRNGITGDKNFIGISSIPLQFIKTLGTIKELEPFTETEENAIKIAGIFGVDPEIIPRKGSSTFTNKNDAEKGLWQNVIKSMCEDKARDLNKIYYLPEEIEFYPDFSKVEALQEDKKTSLESDTILINNLAQLTDAGQDMNQAYSQLNGKYNF